MSLRDVTIYPVLSRAVRRHVTVFCASNLTGCRLTVTGERPFPDVVDAIHARRIHHEQAADLCEALFATLPPATVDALLVAMLERRASVLRGIPR